VAGFKKTRIFMNIFAASLEQAQILDAEDVLRQYRNEFNFPGEKDGRSCIYLCGNSLGLQPIKAAERVRESLDDWATYGVEGHFRGAHPWLSYSREAIDGFAALTGANHDEVVAMNTLTVNLHVLMASFYRPTDSRRKIIIESTAFPSDYFAVQSQIRLHGLDPDACLLEWSPREDELLHLEDLRALVDEHRGEIALMLLPGVQYYTGQVLDMQALCQTARDAGAKIGLDLAHAIGNVELSLHDWAPDFAAWCTYKYLNSGPGAIAGAFVHEKHCNDEAADHLMGWWGHEEASRFKMANQFVAAHGAERWQLSNPPILSLAPVVASLELFSEIGMAALTCKSRKQIEFLTALLETHFAGRIKSITPAAASGCQLSLVVSDQNLHARSVFEALEKRNVIGDWREPNVIRIAPAPLYNSFRDIHEFVVRLADSMAPGKR
jgi:kynureninase